MFRISSVILLFLLISLIAYSPARTKNNALLNKKKPSSFLPLTLDKIHFKDTTFTLNDRDYPVKVNIKIPAVPKPVGIILALHGWSLPATDWCLKTSLCEKALKQGYIIILPDMGKSIYQSGFFPETDLKYRIFPTRLWLEKICFSYLQQKFNLLMPGQRNFVLGLSTGARGSSLLVMDCPDIFIGAGLLSMDCDQTLMPDDPLCSAFYGQYKKFKDRWKNTDNIITLIKKFNVPVYIGHGLVDKIVSSHQSILFYNELKKIHPGLEVKINIDKNAGHDYKYWDSEIDNILNFFKGL